MDGLEQDAPATAFAPGAVVGGDGFFAAVVDVEAGVFPREQVGEFAGADEFGFAQGVEEAMAKEFDGGGARSSAGMQWKVGAITRHSLTRNDSVMGGAVAFWQALWP